MLNPFGNIDEPNAPSWYQPDLPEWLRTVMWYARNPLHNFSHYQAGVVGKDFDISYSTPPGADPAFALDGGLMFAWLKLDWISLPFVSYAGDAVQWYAGWHPIGKLGLRLTLL